MWKDFWPLIVAVPLAFVLFVLFVWFFRVPCLLDY